MARLITWPVAWVRAAASCSLMGADVGVPSEVDLARELDGLRGLVARLRAENARLLRLLELSPREAELALPAQGWLAGPVGPVHARSAAGDKVALYAGLFGARTDVYALRWENDRTGASGWLSAAVPVADLIFIRAADVGMQNGPAGGSGGAVLVCR